MAINLNKSNKVPQNLQTQGGKPQGSGFTNLQRVLQANQGNKLGQAVGQGIASNVGQIKQNVDQAQGQFQAQTDTNRLDTGANRAKISEVINKTGQGPNAISDQDVQQVQKLGSGEYTGPSGLNIDQQKAQAKELAQLGQNKQGLLQRFAGGNQYTQGQQRLDNLLLGGDTVKRSRRSALDLNRELQQADTAASQTANLARAQAQGFGQEVQKQIQDAQDPVLRQIADRAAEAQRREAQQQQVGQNIQDLLSGKRTLSGGLGSYQISELGKDISGNEIGQTQRTPEQQAMQAKSIIDYAKRQGGIGVEDFDTYSALIDELSAQGKNPMEYLAQHFQNQGAIGITPQALTSQQEAAQLDALSRLSGKQSSYVNDLNQAKQSYSDAQRGFNIKDQDVFDAAQKRYQQQLDPNQAHIQENENTIKFANLFKQYQQDPNSVNVNQLKQAAQQAGANLAYGSDDSLIGANFNRDIGGRGSQFLGGRDSFDELLKGQQEDLQRQQDAINRINKEKQARIQALSRFK